MIEVAQYYLIKQLHEREGLSQREIARRLHISRNTVRRYLKEEQVPNAIQRKKVYGSNQKPTDEVLRVLPIIDQWLQEDQHVWKKQRHTAARIYHRLVDEYGFQGSQSNIRRVVRNRRKLLKEVFIPLEFQLGQQFQFDWGEADVILGGQQHRIYLFCIQLSASRKRWVRAYLHEKQEAFLDGFVQAFEYFGGVPAQGLFDNLKTAVVKVLEGRDRLEQEAFQSLQAHYLFQAEFCNVRKGNEKGQVEGLVGYCRRNALVPVPHVSSLEELNELLFKWCETSAIHDQVPHSNQTIDQVWQKEKATLHPLPQQPFEACRLVHCDVSKLSTVTFDTNQYSVPCQYVGQRVWIKGFVDRVVISTPHQIIADHERCYEKSQLRLELDHYLEALLKKPRAVRDAKVMQLPQVPESLRHMHREMHHRFGAEGDRGFIRFLLLHRQHGMDVLVAATEKAREAGVYRYEGLHDIVLHITGEHPPESSLPDDQVPIDLQAYRIKKTDLSQFKRLMQGGEEQ
jgi:transposase